MWDILAFLLIELPVTVFITAPNSTEETVWSLILLVQIYTYKAIKTKHLFGYFLNFFNFIFTLLSVVFCLHVCL